MSQRPPSRGLFSRCLSIECSALRIPARRASLKVFVVLSFSLVVQAQATPGFGDWQFTPFVGATSGASTGYFDPDNAVSSRKLVIGGAVSRRWRRFSVEGELANVPAFFTGEGEQRIVTESNVLSLTGNLMANLPGVGRVRPYAVVGLRALRVRIRDAADVFPVSGWHPAGNVGGGVLVRLTPRVSLGTDVRYTASRRDEGAESSIGFGTIYLDFWRTSVGMAIALR